MRALTGRDEEIYCVAFSPDAKRVVFSGDKLVKIWDVATATEVGSVWEFLESGGVLGGGRGCFESLVMSEMGVRRQVCTMEGHESCVYSVAFSPDGKRVVSGSHDRLVKIWNAETGEEVRSCVRVRC